MDQADEKQRWELVLILVTQTSHLDRGFKLDLPFLIKFDL